MLVCAVPLPFLVLVPNPQPKPRVIEVGDAIRRALVLSEISLKEAAFRMAIDQAELSRMLNQRGPNLARLVNLGPVFMGYLLPLLAQLTEAQVPSSTPQLEGRLAHLEAKMRVLVDRVMGVKSA